MAEFQEVAKMYDRLCKSYDECYKCPMFRNRDKIAPIKNDSISCRFWTLIIDPKTAEEVILHWDKEHPIKTNGMKFREVFGQPYEHLFEANEFIKQWLSQEYKGGQDE